jgi:lysophospholipase
MVAGSLGGQNLPIWPLLQPERQVDVIVANDNSDDTQDKYPDGTALYNAYTDAQAAGLNTMPEIPPPAVFVDLGLNKKPTFFGCQGSSTTIVYLPNTNYTMQSNISSYSLDYTPDDVTNMIINGNMVATMGGNSTWPYCLACGILLKVNNGMVPQDCSACLREFCWPSFDLRTMPASNMTSM